MRSSITTLIMESVDKSVSLANKNKLRLLAENLPQRDIQSSLKKFLNDIQLLKNKDAELNRELISLKNLLVIASKKGSIASKLEEKLSLVKKAQEDYIEAKSIQTQIMERFGKNRSASKLRKEADDLVTITENTKMRAVTALSKIAKSHRPKQLTSKDEITNTVVSYIQSSLRETDGKKKPTLDAKSSVYSVDFGSKNEIRFARFIPIKNLPTTLGTTKDLYLVLAVTLYAHKQRQGKIVPYSKEDISNLFISLVSNVVDPMRIKDLYEVKSLRNAKDILSYLSQKHSLIALLGEPISSTPERRREKTREKLKILNNDDIKISQNKTFFHVKIPSKLVPPLTTNDVTDWEKSLYLDMKRIAGLPMASRYNTGRLRVEKREKSKNGKYWEFVYRVLPMSPDNDLVKDKDLAHPLGDEEYRSAISNLSKEVKNWL